MISKKKKSLHQNIFGNQPSLQQSGLFTAKFQKQHLLDQLKRGTLFNFYPKNKHPPLATNQSQSHYQYRQDNDWLSHIRLAEQEQIQQKEQPLTQLSKTQTNSKHFPKILNLPIKKPQGILLGSNKCGKLVCYQKKLKYCGAWNKQNPNSIEKNIKRLAQNIQRNQKQMTNNDFKKTKGLGFNYRSFDDSIMLLGVDTQISTNNAFSNLSFMNSTNGLRKDREKGNKQNKSWNKNNRNDQSHFIPSFLLQSILLQKQQKKSKK